MRQTDRSVVTLVLAIALSLAVNGCTRISTQTGEAPHSYTIPGVLRVGFYESLDNLNPLLSLQTYVGQVETLIFSGLVQYDDHYRLVPDVAAVVLMLANGGVSKDGLTIKRYLLRHDVRFSDGTPLTSADVARTWQQAENPLNNTPNREPADRVESVTTPDPYTVVCASESALLAVCRQLFPQWLHAWRRHFTQSLAARAARSATVPLIICSLLGAGRSSWSAGSRGSSCV